MRLMDCVRWCAVVILVTGCTMWPRLEQERLGNVSMVNMLFQESAENAVITERTIRPWHFISDTAVLNEVGEHDLEVLADHFKNHGGNLHMPQGR
ncbi:MAG: hypothetical protein HY706_14730, partial [Candidatus Hydrogenedentes bacterium]|nr:hypothetical protein [Candidatus Hydrogenedentota bacterium]